METKQKMKTSLKIAIITITALAVIESILLLLLVMGISATATEYPVVDCIITLDHELQPYDYSEINPQMTEDLREHIQRRCAEEHINFTKDFVEK